MARMSTARILAYAALVTASVGAVLGMLLPAWAVHALSVAIILAGSAAWSLGRAPPARIENESDDSRFQRELRVNTSSLVLIVVFLLLALTELLAIPAALGQLVVFSAFGLGFISYYPVLIALLVGALAWATLLASARPDLPTLSKRDHTLAYAAAGLSAGFVLAAVGVAAGLAEGVGIRAERSVFVLAASLVTLFFFVKTWLRLPAYSAVTEWLENEERFKRSALLRNIAYALLVVASVGVLLTLIPAMGLAPKNVGLLGTGVAMLALLAATFNVGVSHVVARLEMGMENAAEVRRKRRIVLSAISIGLTVLTAAVAALTFFAFLAQAGGVALFDSLLEAFVQYYLVIFALVLVPLIVAVVVRTRFQTEIRYSDALKAVAMGTATLTIVLVFFGVFIGGGLAEGSGISIDNAVLVMGAAVLCLIQFVKARTLLPGVYGMIRDAVTQSAHADTSTQEKIKNQMIWTYVLGLLFVVGAVGFIVATSLGVVDTPASSLGTDVGFFVYLLFGIALLVIVVMRYFQSVNIDQRWSTKKKVEETIGKRRLTSEEVKRYLILGFSIGTASLLGVIGLLIQFGVVTNLGPLAVNRKYATDFFVFGILMGIGPYGWYHNRENTRIAAIDQKFPEFMRDLAESQRAGMTLTDAVITAAQGQYGQLTPDIRKMAAQIEWGVPFTDALARFAKRVNTPLINRTVSLVNQASDAGGNVVDVLTAAADDSREIQQIVKERTQAMSIYVMIIYIAFAVFIGVIAVLNAQFIPEVAKAVAKADGVSIGGLKFKAFDQDDFKILFFHAAIIQGFGGGLVAGVMSGGTPTHGLRHSFFLVLVGWVLFRLVIG